MPSEGRTRSLVTFVRGPVLTQQQASSNYTGGLCVRDLKCLLMGQSGLVSPPKRSNLRPDQLSVYSAILAAKSTDNVTSGRAFHLELDLAVPFGTIMLPSRQHPPPPVRFYLQARVGRGNVVGTVPPRVPFL